VKPAVRKSDSYSAAVRSRPVSMANVVISMTLAGYGFSHASPDSCARSRSHATLRTDASA
jgi:hypothetical protein